MTETSVHDFFAGYRKALLTRDAQAIADMYAVPGLILFPGNSIPVTDPQQTADFFAASWDQYEGIDEAEAAITVMAETPASAWADVTWTYGGRVQERFCYQLVMDAGGCRIAVLTPLPITGAEGDR